MGYPKISSCIHNLFKLLTNLVEFYPAIQKETTKPENAHSLGPMHGGSKKQKNCNAPAHPLVSVSYQTNLVGFSMTVCAVGNVSGNRCESECRSRGREIRSQPGPVLSWRLIMK